MTAKDWGGGLGPTAAVLQFLCGACMHKSQRATQPPCFIACQSPLVLFRSQVATHFFHPPLLDVKHKNGSEEYMMSFIEASLSIASFHLDPFCYWIYFLVPRGHLYLR